MNHPTRTSGLLVSGTGAARRIRPAWAALALGLLFALAALLAAPGAARAQSIEEVAESWRYSGGQAIENPNTDDDDLSLLDVAYSTWKQSYGTSYLGIVSSDGTTTTKVAVEGAVRVVIDVSKWQGSIDWEKVAASGVTAAIIRCGYGSDYTKYDDTYFIENVEGAQAAGIEIGIYLYSYATTTTGAASEAAHVLRLLEEAGLDPADLALPVFYDMEDSTQRDLGEAQLGALAETFCDTIAAEGYSVGIYANLNWWNNYLTDDAFDNESWYKWVARYPASKTVASYGSGVEDADLWQFTSHGTVSGISGNVDVSFDFLGSGSYLSVATLKSVTLSSSWASATLKWAAVSWADGYEIWRASGNGYKLLTSIESGTTTSYTDSTLEAGYTYKYKIRPYSTYTTSTVTETTVVDEETGEESTTEETVTTTARRYGVYSSMKSVSTKLAKVTSVTAARNSKGSIKLTWGKVSNADGYVIYRSVNGGSYTKVKTIKSGSTTSWTNSSVTTGTVYRYKIRAYKKVNGTTVYSSSYSAVKKYTARPAAPTLTSLTSSKKRAATIKWGKVSGATGYQMAYRIKGTSKWYYVTTTNNYVKFTALRNKKYYVKVRAYVKVNGTKLYGNWSSSKLLTVKQ